MTTLIYNGKVYLKKGLFCEAILIKDGRIVRTGSSAELREEAPGKSEKIDAGGALVLPAFHDSHLHLMWLGRREGGIEGAGARSVEEVVSRGRELIARLKPPEGTFIQGAGVNPDLFSVGEKRDLTRDDVDKISTEYPVIISRHCGHTIYCNSLALKLAGLSESARHVEGGTIEQDENGRPTGVLRENANALVRSLQPESSKEEMKSFLRLAMGKAQSLGISACGSYDTGGPDFESVLAAYREIYDEARGAGKPALRIAMQCGISTREDMLDAHLARGIRSGAPLWDDPHWGTFLKMQSIKLFADGTLGGRTAWMRRPYRDQPDTSGFPVLEQASLNHLVQKAAAGGMQVLIHAIGDAGIDASITAIENVTGPGRNPLRHGIIHCQITSPELLERMARNKIYALVQPIFLADDMPIVESRVGPELASTSYAWGTLQKLGVPVSYGTDAPVSVLNPLLGIEWAVTRKPCQESADSSGPPPFYSGEQVDIYTAFDDYSEASAFSNFSEYSLGRIAPGFFADLAFLDRDIFTIPSEDIHKAKVQRTMCAGETVYSA